MAEQYDNLAGTEMDVKDHPDRYGMDADAFAKDAYVRRKISEIGESMDFNRALKTSRDNTATNSGYMLMNPKGK